jgi:NAD(P)-dependent dehydrogenase (short-subunit alcohol dehydrogenase family)
MKYSLEGRAALITGASQGLGLAIAKSYAEAGADVFLCARDFKMLEQAKAEVALSAGKARRIEVQAADVSNRSDVEKLVARAIQLFPHLTILINNAGVYGPKGLIEEIDWDEWVRAIEINLLGSILMCRAVLPHFKARQYGKIVQLSGGGATAPLPRLSAYAASKAAVVRFAETLAEEVRNDHIDVNAVAPGALNTRLLDEVLAAGPKTVGQDFYDRAVEQKKRGGAPLETGAHLAVFLGSSASDGITGKLLSAVWDPWEQLTDHIQELQKTDVYTLRRIVPEDRALKWKWEAK